MVRAKFRCLEVTERFTHFDSKPAPDGKGYVQDFDRPKTQVTVRLVPVQHKGSAENKTFWEATPSGELTMTITNPEAALQFVPGKVYYLDFSVAAEAPE